MSQLTNELKQDHALIATTLKKVKDLGITSPEGQSLLASAKEKLLAHLKKEDEKLYPALQKEAQKNKDLKSVLDTYATEMSAISKTALDFFKKYEKGGSGIEFAKDFGKLIATLSSRIQKEESVLYSRYDQVAH